MIRPLEQVLADYAAEAQILERAGHAHDASRLRRVLDDVRNASVDYLTWLSELDARIRSNKSVAWLRSRFPEWQRAGHARFHPERPRERQYRALVVPLAANASVAREAGRRGEEGWPQ